MSTQVSLSLCHKLFDSVDFLRTLSTDLHHTTGPTLGPRLFLVILITLDLFHTVNQSLLNSYNQVINTVHMVWLGSTIFIPFVVLHISSRHMIETLLKHVEFDKVLYPQKQKPLTIEYLCTWHVQERIRSFFFHIYEILDVGLARHWPPRTMSLVLKLRLKHLHELVVTKFKDVRFHSILTPL